jgi:hypothetical protein
MSLIQQETDLIQLLKSINNGTPEIVQQIEYAEIRLKELEYDLRVRREKKTFVRRIEKEVGQEKLALYFTSHGLYHLLPYFKHMTLNEFKRSDPIDWVPLSEYDLRLLMYLL